MIDENDQSAKHGGRKPIFETDDGKYYALIEGEWYLGEVSYTKSNPPTHLFRRDVCYVKTYNSAHGRGVWVSPYDIVKKLPKGAKEAKRTQKKDFQTDYRAMGGASATKPDSSRPNFVGSRKRPREQGGEGVEKQEWQQRNKEKIMQVQAITHWEEDLCQDMLQQSGWNVEAAINQILSSGMMGGATSPMLPPMDSPPALPMDQPPVPLKMKKTLSLVDDSDILDDLNLEEDGKLDLSDFLFRLPDISSDYEELQAQRILASITDAAVQHDLQKQAIINTDDRETHFIPLKTENDGNCLLHSISVSLYGQHDRKLALRRCLRSVFRDNGCEFSDALKNRWGICQMEDREVSDRQLDAGFTTLKKQASLSKVQDAWGRLKHAFLESTHVLFLAHIIRRPILIYAAGPEDSDGNIYPADDICGLYLPFEIPTYECYPTPLILAFAGSHFTPLVCIENDSNPKQVLIPDRMPIQFLKSEEDRRQLIEDYLQIEMDGDTEELFALLDFGEYPDAVRELLSQWLEKVVSLESDMENQNPGGMQAGDKPEETYQPGDVVEVRDSPMAGWQWGVVKTVKPLQIEIFGVPGLKAFNFVRKTGSGEPGATALDETKETLALQDPIQTGPDMTIKSPVMLPESKEEEMSF